MTSALMRDIGEAFYIDLDSLIEVQGKGDLPSYFDVTSLAAASIGAAGLMLARFTPNGTASPSTVSVDRRLASFWFGLSMRPQGWQLPPIWDAVAGDYQAKDGWVRLHTNAPHHRARAMAVLGVDENRDAVAKAVYGWEMEALEAAIVGAGGCAAAMRCFNDWAAHPQGKAIAKEPLVLWEEHGQVTPKPLNADPKQPLAGLRVLDLTRVLAGPAATRFLAAFGADVLRIDPPHWDEAVAVQEMTLGKRCARLDLRTKDDRAVFEALLKDADIIIHGYRADALRALDYGPDERRFINPGVIDISLNAYGWTGPWSTRRGFDSLVQMSSGIADFGMRRASAEKPFPLPVQALDHSTGYFMAAAALRALALRQEEGKVFSARMSLARTAHLLSAFKHERLSGDLSEATEADLDPWVETTVWGDAKRLRFPVQIGSLAPIWAYPAGPLGTSEPAWADAASR